YLALAWATSASYWWSSIRSIAPGNLLVIEGSIGAGAGPSPAGRSARRQPPQADAAGPAVDDAADQGRLDPPAAQVADQAPEAVGGDRQQPAARGLGGVEQGGPHPGQARRQA